MNGSKSMVGVLFGTLLAALWAQDYRASLLGRITDASTAAVPSASVTVTNEATRLVYRTTSNDEGYYLVPLLEPGTYSVEVEAPGFKKSRKEGLAIQTGAKITLNIELEVGQVTESVTVRAEAPLLQTASADIGQVIDRRFVDQLYIANRNPLALASLTAGVRGGGGRFSDSGQHYLSILGGGGQEGRNEIVVDGASVTMPRQGGAIAISPSGDAVEELRVQTTMFDASYGRSNGGVISYSTRSGTNELHGSFEYFYRNKALNANSWLNNRKGLPRPNDPRKFSSGVIGGPIVLPKLYDGRNRTFFFASVQYDSRWSNPTYGGRVPTELERQGDFSQTLSPRGNAAGDLQPVHDRNSGIESGAAAMARQPDSLGDVQQDRLDDHERVSQTDRGRAAADRGLQLVRAEPGKQPRQTDQHTPGSHAQPEAPRLWPLCLYGLERGVHQAAAGAAERARRG